MLSPSRIVQELMATRDPRRTAFRSLEKKR